jgi:UDP-GlcNAc:undecaprenyl-phosphate GlcNAc-1-phosphate transferase
MFLSVLTAFLVSSGICGWCTIRQNQLWLDQPGERSLHVIPVPRLGGVGIWIGFSSGLILGWEYLKDVFDKSVFQAGILLLIVALVDDRRRLNPVIRLLAQLIAALLTVFVAKIYIQFDFSVWLWMFLSLIAIVWGINLYNFMDGIDGLAGSMAVIGFSALGLLGFLQNQMPFSFLCSLLIVANIGFLFFNFPPAKIFMGDSGSTLLGFSMVVVSILGWKLGIYTVWIPLGIFAPFWFDATYTLLNRMLRKEKIWLPHREHVYQRWVLRGYSHRRVTTAYIFLMVFSAALAVAWQVYFSGYNHPLVFSIWILVCSVVLAYSEKILKLHNKVVIESVSG